MELMSQEDTKELDDTGKEQISLSRQDVGGFSVGNAQGIFQRADRTLHTGTAVVYASKSWIVAGDARIQA